ncbi:SGNH/GDSL hydrolase family protein [Bacillus sp. ISL-47]|uniref:IPT/TIG domain-containing protein n=1 Tax=Bacillus sp. ISL-47 TaxID=2819130 RepID=UPI001BE6DDB0|nr:IPT/TIG domain-containing protein [Bacillus sp. ISL-47]MBT2687376.1 SGNH/GDSL hydrolase family protein [Bacillus sp. ISL-47]MBT2707162.1 SGNH/GDSL hydrolase family protein [Pseudomonas sp. ISL-84]
MPNVMLKEMLIKPLPFNLNVNPATVNLTNNRMQHHKAILESFGITSLSGLGKLTIRGNVIPQSGLTKPETSVMGAETLFQSVFRSTEAGQNGMRFEPAGGRAVQLKAIPFPQQVPVPPIQPKFPGPIKGPVRPFPGPISRRTVSPPPAPANLVRSTNTVPIDTAYWAAEEIDLEDNTLVILKYPQKHLIILAEKITVGKNVTFTWERPNIQKPAKPAKKSQVQGFQTSTTLGGITGKDGIAGIKGEPGLDGADAPELEIWMLELNGSPAFDLRGQDGTQGGDGQDGQDGGNGWKGRAGIKDFAGAWCTSGAGAGGNGGRGGAAGNGGDGGDGGHGGKLSLYAPQSVINNYLQKGFYVTVDGGKGGPGGIPGVPGAGGKGGPVGDSVKAIFETCGPRGGRSAGQPGAQGYPGSAGYPGKDGERFTEPLSMKVIDSDEYRRKLLEPAIFHTMPNVACIGDTVSIDGKRFTKTDVVLVEGIPAQTLVYSDTKLQFTVPSIKGGSRSVQVKQSDNTLSNRGTIFVKPRLLSAMKTRVQPGSKVQLAGTGFAEGAMVKVNDQNMPDVKYISPTSIEFTLIRPVNIQNNPTGEKVRVKVMLGNGTPSNEIELVLETFQMLVLGDSIQWGQGLMEHEKFHSLVVAAVQARTGGIGFYKEVLAHSGAIIGAGNTEVHPRLPGEVPSKFPTILQQADMFTGSADFVDLILLDGGFNDIGITNVLNPHGPDLVQPSQKIFFEDMKKLLLKVSGTFKNAKIIVTGYYQPLSEQSNTAFIKAMLTALGVVIGGIPVAAATVLSAVEIQLVIARSKQIMELSRMHLKNAVEAVNHTFDGGNRIFFADPNFGPSHAGLTNDPFLYGIHPNLSPEDINVAPSRAVDCVNSNQSGLDLELCRIASVGHPNPKGAKAYADSIIPLL